LSIKAPQLVLSRCATALGIVIGCNFYLLIQNRTRSTEKNKKKRFSTSMSQIANAIWQEQCVTFFPAMSPVISSCCWLR